MSANSSTTASDWLTSSQRQLKQVGVATARLDCLVLLEDEARKDRGWLLAHPEFELSVEQVTRLNTKIAQRALHHPLAYIRGTTEFFGRDFAISPAVLEPRPESETMITLLLDLPDIQTKNYHIADVGTGSGALGITTKLELPKCDVDLLEIDASAIEIAKKNVISFATSIRVIESDLLASSPGNYDLLLCNLPYVPDSFQINTAATHEPKLAIFGGPDGLDLYKLLFSQIKHLSKQPLFILTESMPLQHIELAQIAKNASYRLTKTDDFIQLFQLVK